jgi:hypothetical protein
MNDDTTNANKPEGAEDSTTKVGSSSAGVGPTGPNAPANQADAAKEGTDVGGTRATAAMPGSDAGTKGTGSAG